VSTRHGLKWISSLRDSANVKDHPIPLRFRQSPSTQKLDLALCALLDPEMPHHVPYVAYLYVDIRSALPKLL